ncbi:LuxR family transcriptional regulator [bacterium]|jgi:DNA-binding NarL/FixJ family response regulator|nr:LuxR family transcriptional regulator [bacterium]
MRSQQDIETIYKRLAALEANVQMLANMLRVHPHQGPPVAETSTDFAAFGVMTPKQNATLQMILRGARNKEIADRFGVTESTAKIYLTGIMRHVGVTNRAAVIMKMSAPFKEISADEYRRITTVPKDWDLNWNRHKSLKGLERRA